MGELGKFDLQINNTPNELEQYMNFSTNNKLTFVDSFYFLSSSLNSLVKNFDKDYFEYSSEESDNTVLDLIKQKWFYSYEHISNLVKFKEKLPSREKFYSSLTGKNCSYKEYENAKNVWNKFEM